MVGLAKDMFYVIEKRQLIRQSVPFNSLSSEAWYVEALLQERKHGRLVR